MRIAIALLGILFCHALPAVDAPRIEVGDWILVYAQIIDCGSGLQAIDAGEVDENGAVTLLGDVLLVAIDKPVHEVRDELVDFMEERTGHRSQSLELRLLPGDDVEVVAKRLSRFYMEMRTACSRGAPLHEPLDPNSTWAKKFERFVHSSYGKSFEAASPIEKQFA